MNSLPNDAQSKVLLKTLISGLGDKFDNNVVKIDNSVFNTSQNIPYRKAESLSCIIIIIAREKAPVSHDMRGLQVFLKESRI